MRDQAEGRTQNANTRASSRVFRSEIVDRRRPRLRCLNVLQAPFARETRVAQPPSAVAFHLAAKQRSKYETSLHQFLRNKKNLRPSADPQSYLEMLEKTGVPRYAELLAFPAIPEKGPLYFSRLKV